MNPYHNRVKAVDCRMLIAVGNMPVKELLDGFLQMAQNNNEVHEFSGTPGHMHGDGWGYVRRINGKLEHYREAIPCWADERYHELYTGGFDLLLLHARKASPRLPKSKDFTHPFERDGWYFCHNGTIEDPDFKGGSDSEKLFHKILENISIHGNPAVAIKETVRKIKNYTALNLILTNGRDAYVLNYYSMKEQTKHPKYYTMKYLKADRYIVASSEHLKTIQGEWREIGNRRLLHLDTVSLTVKAYNV